MKLDIKAWAKSPEGKGLIEQQTPFVANGEIWQGYNQVMMRTEETQLTDKELEAIPDLDGTKTAIWLKRHQRLEGRVARKTEEYGKRRAELRARRNELLTSVERNERLGIDSDVERDEIRAIDMRMKRLLDAAGRDQLLIAQRQMDAGQAETDDPVILPATVMPTALTAPCGKMSPPTAANPQRWLKGHKMGCKKCSQR